MNDLYGDRMGALRQRFAEQFDSRIEGIETAMLQLEDDDFVDLANAHRNAHQLCGIGATLGFVGTGTVARAIEQILLAAVKAGRALTDDEIPCLRAGIALLRSTAGVEMRSAHWQGGRFEDFSRGAGSVRSIADQSRRFRHSLTSRSV